VNLYEQVALVGLSFGHALRASRRPATWLPWLLVPGTSLLALLALAWCAHPLLSPVMAPLLRASVGEEALRYPGLYVRLPEIVVAIRFVLDGLVLPVAFGGSVLGRPIGHSVSPPMHNAALAALAREDRRFADWRYFRFDVAPEELPRALERLHARHFLGLNLTAPHKVIAVSCVAAMDDAARPAGAIKIPRLPLFTFLYCSAGLPRQARLRQWQRFRPGGWCRRATRRSILPYGTRSVRPRSSRLRDR